MNGPALIVPIRVEALPVGAPEEALECACGLSLADPSAWQEHLPPASP